MYSPVCRSTMAICWKLGWKSQPIIFMAAPFVRVLVFCKIKLTRTSLGAVVVMKSGAAGDLPSVVLRQSVCQIGLSSRGAAEGSALPSVVILGDRKSVV